MLSIFLLFVSFFLHFATSVPTVVNPIADMDVEFDSDFLFQIPKSTFGNVEGPLWITVDTTDFPVWLQRKRYDIGNITQVGELAGSFGYIHVDGDYAYVSQAPYLKIIDLTDPVNPEYTDADLYVNTQFRKVETFNGGRSALVTIWSTSASNNLRVLNVTDKNDPTSLYSLSNTAKGIQGMHIEGDYAYIVSGSPVADLEIYSVKNVSNVEQVGWRTGLGMGLDVDARDGWAYIADGAGSGSTTGIFCVDVSDPTSPFFTGGHDETFNQAKNVMIAEKNSNFVFLTTGQYVYLYNYTDKNVAEYYTGYASSGYNANGFVESNGLLFSVHDKYNAGPSSLMVIDAYYWSQFDGEDPTVPGMSMLGFVDDERFLFEDSEFRKIVFYKNYLYVVDTSIPALRVFDINMLEPEIAARDNYEALATGETTVTITATDSTGSVSTSFTITVECDDGMYGLYCNETDPVTDDNDDSTGTDNDDSSDDDNDDNGDNSTGLSEMATLIVAIVVPVASVAICCICLILILVCICCCCCCLRKKKKDEEFEVEMTQE